MQTQNETPAKKQFTVVSFYVDGKDGNGMKLEKS